VEMKLACYLGFQQRVRAYHEKVRGRDLCLLKFGESMHCGASLMRDESLDHKKELTNEIPKLGLKAIFKRRCS
jgi:hypothetical protein